MNLSRREFLSVLVVCLLGLTVWTIFRVYTQIRLEDGLITFRFVQNLASGNGFVFNPGERVLGTTTPFFTLLLAFICFIFSPAAVSLAADVVLFLSSLAAGLFTYYGLQAIGASPKFRLFVLALFMLHPLTLWTTAGGMETPLVICLMAAGFYGIASQKPLFAAVASALLVLTRIDGVFWAAGIYFLIWLNYRREFLRSAGLGLAVILPWIVFAALYFGSPIPNTVTAKYTIGQENAGFSLSGFFSEARWFANRFAASSPFGTAAGLLFFASGVFSIFRQKRISILVWLCIFPFLFALAFYFGRAPRFPWYFIPVAWTAMIVGGYGLWYLADWLKRWMNTSSLLSYANQASFIVFLVFFIMLARAGITTASLHKSYQENEDGLRKVVGLWLKNHVAPQQAVAMEAVGYQGFYSERRVIDLAGLVSPGVVDIRKSSASNGEAFYRILSELRPDYIVLRSYEADTNRHFHGGPLFDTAEQQNYFEFHYREAAQFSAPHTELWGNYSYLTIFERIS